MDIFYLKKSEVLPHINFTSLRSFSDGRNFKSPEKEEEHLLGIFLTKFVARHVYGIQNIEIEYSNKKPYFKNNEIFFSISHSNDIVMVVFNSSQIGADIEFMKDRKNYELIMRRYGIEVSAPSKGEFYKFWTMHEAKIKLGSDNIKSSYSKIVDLEYMFSCVSDNSVILNYQMKKLFCTGNNIILEDELNLFENIKFDIINYGE